MVDYVLDASVIIKFFDHQEESLLDQSDEILADVKAGRSTIHCPELTKYEIANVMLKGKNYSLNNLKKGLSLFYSLPIRFHSETEDDYKTTCSIALKYSLTYYDACYLQIAKKLGAIFITADSKLIVKNSDIIMLHLKDYANL